MKSNIGHLKAAAGAAGLFKTVLTLHDKVIVPSLNFRRPEPERRLGALAVPGQHRTARVAGRPGRRPARRRERVRVRRHQLPRRPRGARPGPVPGGRGTRLFAGVDLPRTATTPAPATTTDRRPPLRGALVVGGASREDVAEQLRAVRDRAAVGTAPLPAVPDPTLAGVAVRVAVDFADAGDLEAKLDRVLTALTAPPAAAAPQWKMLRAQGAFLGEGAPGKVAFLYPGQGSQYVDMLRTLREREPVVAATFDEADDVMAPLLGAPLTSFLFAGDDAASRERMEQRLTQTEITQPAMLTTDLALTRLLGTFGIRPDMVMGHSLGEYAALVTSGALDFRNALEAVSARGREMAHLHVEDKGAMAAVFGPLDVIEQTIAGTYVVVANVNSLRQAVVGGPTAAVERVVGAFAAQGITATRIPVSHAFHTSIVAPISDPLMAAVRRMDRPAARAAGRRERDRRLLPRRDRRRGDGRDARPPGGLAGAVRHRAAHPLRRRGAGVRRGRPEEGAARLRRGRARRARRRPRRLHQPSEEPATSRRSTRRCAPCTPPASAWRASLPRPHRRLRSHLPPPPRHRGPP